MTKPSPIHCPTCNKPADVIREIQNAVDVETTYSWDGEGFVEIGREEHGGERDLQCAACGTILPFGHKEGEESNENVLFNLLK